MLKYIFLFFFISSYAAAANFNLTLPSSQEQLLFNGDDTEIVVNHRILAKVNGKMISVIDVMKKMDMTFYQHYPQYANSNKARLQYYQMHWKRVLQDLIDRELVAADALEHHLSITNGDVRHEMELTLGPNIIENLDKAGLTLEEAQKMVQEDVILRQMMTARVNNKAQKAITPRNVRLAYEEFVKQNRRPPEWIYTVLSIRQSNAAQGEETSKQIYEALRSGALLWDSDLLDNVKKMEIDPTASITLSNEYRHTEKEMSLTNKEVLIFMTPGSYSSPIAQKSRSDQSTVYRIYYLQDKSEGSVPSLAEVENDLKNKLYQQAIEKETKIYLKRLHEHFGYSDNELKETIPEDFEPFM